MSELIILGVVIVVLTISFFVWSACKLAKESDIKHDIALRKYLREKSEEQNNQNTYIKF